MPTFSSVQRKELDASSPCGPAFDVGPTEGNLLVCTMLHRSGTALASCTIGGTGWTERVALGAQLADGTYRRAIKQWTKTAGASEPATITVTASGIDLYVSIQEFASDEAVTWTFREQASNASPDDTSSETVLATGTTASVGAGDLLLIGSLMVKTTSQFPDWTASWASENLSGLKQASGNGDARGWATGFLQQSGAGTKASTVTITGAQTGNDGLLASIIVFEGEGAAAASCAVTGTATASITEADVVAGTKTVLLELTGDTWIPA